MPGQPIGGQETTFNGNVTYNAGSGSDSINLAGFGRGTGVGTTINGNLNIDLGDGNNNFGDVAFGGGNNGGLDYSETTISGNLNLTSGNGSNVMDFFGIPVAGTEAFHFGNGNNGTAAVPIMIRRPGSQLIWTSGNGNDYLQLATPLVTGLPCCSTWTSTSATATTRSSWAAPPETRAVPSPARWTAAAA